MEISMHHDEWVPKEEETVDMNMKVFKREGMII